MYKMKKEIGIDLTNLHLIRLLVILSNLLIALYDAKPFHAVLLFCDLLSHHVLEFLLTFFLLQYFILHSIFILLI